MRKMVDFLNNGGFMTLTPFLVFVNRNLVAADSSKVYSFSVLGYNAVTLISKSSKSRHLSLKTIKVFGYLARKCPILLQLGSLMINNYIVAHKTQL